MQTDIHTKDASTLNSSREELRKKLETLLQEWRKDGVPPQWSLQEILREIIDWRKESGSAGLWKTSPLMITATLDDGWGHGIKTIELCGEAAGLRVLPLGILQPPEKILAACASHSPEILGLTVLQFDSEDALAYIRKNLPEKTLLVAGGPLFRIDPEFAHRTGVHYAARSIVDFLEFLLSLHV